MGWWPIDPETGMPAEDKPSKHSNEYDGFVLLNADPVVDREESTHYLGDAPWDSASSLTCELNDLVDDPRAIDEEDWRAYFTQGKIPAKLAAERSVALELQKLWKSFWDDINEMYSEDWNRPATSAEKRWIAEYATERLLRVDEDDEGDTDDEIVIHYEIQTIDADELEAELEDEDCEGDDVFEEVEDEYASEEYEVEDSEEEITFEAFETEKPKPEENEDQFRLKDDEDEFTIEDEGDDVRLLDDEDDFSLDDEDGDDFSIEDEDDEARDYDIDKY